MSSNPIVEIEEGLLRGRQQTSVRGGSSYFSFQGIPYAEPPVGPLRFKAPVPVIAWMGTKDALIEGPGAPSLSGDILNPDTSENCLYLNVYTPELPESGDIGKRDVLFWIHGGAFTNGTGSTAFYGPDYLVPKGVVVVTINYRLGALGFLSLKSELCPGNNGLRDMALALRWVQRNISVFGGNPNNVTIFGESAGGAAVLLLLMSPQTKGLFHRAISQSAGYLESFGYERPMEAARALGELCGLKTENDAELLEFLSTRTVEDIVTQSANVVNFVQPTYFVNAPFHPVSEAEGSDTFLPAAADVAIRDGLFHDVPFMSGVNTLDGLIAVDPKHGLEPLNTDEELARLLPPHPTLDPGSPSIKAIVDKIRQFYFADGFDEKKLADAISSVYFFNQNYAILQGLTSSVARSSKIFSYVFTYDTKLSIFRHLYGYEDWVGTFHGDDVLFLFYQNSIPPEIEPGNNDDQMIDFCTDMWINFAKTGNPTPDDNLWRPYTSEGKECLDIKMNRETVNDYDSDEMKFWSGILKDMAEASEKP